MAPTAVKTITAIRVSRRVPLANTLALTQEPVMPGSILESPATLSVLLPLHSTTAQAKADIEAAIADVDDEFDPMKDTDGIV